MAQKICTWCHDEVFSADGVGTMFYTDQYIEINKSTSPDIAEIMRLIQPQIDLNLLYRHDLIEPKYLASHLLYAD